MRLIVKAVFACVVMVSVSGCATPFLKAMKAFDQEKVMGTNDPSFMLSNETFVIKSGLFIGEKFKEHYLARICDNYNNDKTMQAMYKEGLIKKPPVCLKEIDTQNALIVDVGYVRDDCFLGMIGFKCHDKYNRYLSNQGDLLAYSEVRRMDVFEHIDYSVGHIKNMVIMANLKANEDDPEYVKKIEKFHKKYGG